MTITEKLEQLVDALGKIDGIAEEALELAIPDHNEATNHLRAILQQVGAGRASLRVKLAQSRANDAAA